MAGGGAASALLSLSDNSVDLAMVDDLLRTFRAAVARGEGAYLALLCGAGQVKIKINFKPKAAAGPPAAARLSPRPQPAAAGPTSPSGASPSPAGGRRKAPRRRGPGALLRDERRRHLRIAPDVFTHQERRGRCPLRPSPPALPPPTLAPVSGPVHRRWCAGMVEGRDLRFTVLGNGDAKQLLQRPAPKKALRRGQPAAFQSAPAAAGMSGATPSAISTSFYLPLLTIPPFRPARRPLPASSADGGWHTPPSSPSPLGRRHEAEAVSPIPQLDGQSTDAKPPWSAANPPPWLPAGWTMTYE